MKLSALIIGLLVLASCKSKDELPKDVLPEPAFRAVYWDLIRSGQYLNAFVINRDTSLAASENFRFNQRIFELHKITRQQFETSYKYYREHPVLMKRVLDSLAKQPPVVIETPADTTGQAERRKSRGMRITDSIRKTLIQPIEGK